MPMSSGANVQTMGSTNLINKNTDRDSKDCHRGTKLVALQLNGNPFETRHRKHRLLFLYKMLVKLSPEFIPLLILNTVYTLSRYHLSR